jgi:hypothetical protein
MTSQGEGWDLNDTKDYVPAHAAGAETYNGREIVFESFGDEAEVDALRNELLLPMSSEKIRGYLGDMLEYLSWPVSKDGFDFDESGKEIDPSEAHELRRAWERTLAGADKLILDKTAFSWNQIGGILNMFAFIQQFTEMPVMAEQFKGKDGTVPAEVIREVGDTATSLLAELNTSYKTLGFAKRLAVVKEFRTFVKVAVRKLLDAYTTTQAREA